MTVEAKNRLEIDINETIFKSKVEFNGQQIGLVNKVEIEVSAEEKLAKAKLYFWLPKVSMKAVDDQIEIFRAAGVSVKDFSDVVKERDEAVAKLKKRERLIESGAIKE